MRRFQECSWFVRLWRRRWYLLVPFWWARGIWSMRDREIREDFTEEQPFHWRDAVLIWTLMKGLAESKMEWWYSAEEVFGDDWNALSPEGDT